MKKLIIINGTMGVGKTTVCRLLLKRLKPSVWLDGDWCWQMNPWVVSAENKRMVIDNITYLLRNYLSNQGYEYIIFCWVIHQEEIFREILASLKEFEFDLYKISLLCSAAALRERLERDVAAGVRNETVIERSISRLDCYQRMNTMKLDVSEIGSEQAAEELMKFIKNGV